MTNRFSGNDISLIEAKVPEEVTLMAEDVVDNGKISGLVNPRPSEWEAIVIDKNIHFSVVLKIKADKLVSCKCNCNVYAREQICGHILAIIFKIRKEHTKPNKKKRTTKSQTSTSKPKSINISELLSKLTKAELESFILTKSRADKNFKLLLQGRFLEKLAPNQLAPYIESTFPILTKANEKVAPSKLNTFLDISEELINHFRNLVAKDELTEAYMLSYLHLKKTFYIKFNLKKEHARFFRLHKNLLSNYKEVYKLIEAPEYRQDIHVQLEELLSASYISASLTEEKDLWMLHYKNKDYREKLAEIVNSYLSRNSDSDFNSYYFIRMLSVILKKDKASRTTVIDRMDMQESYRVIQFLEGYKQVEACQECLHLFFISKKLNHPLAKLIISSLEVNKSYKKELLTNTVQYYLLYKDQIYTSFLRELSTNWEQTKTELIQSITAKNDIALLVKFHLENGDPKEAISVFQKNLSWKLLKTFDTQIAEYSENECKDLYYLTMADYLEDHFGVIAIDFVREVMHRLNYLGFKGWIPELKDQLVSKYPERKGTFQA